MPWQVPVDQIVKSGLELYKQRDLIASTAKKMLYLVSNGVLRILVFGRGGVGKSEMGWFLSANDPAAARPADYTPNRQIEKKDLPNVWGGLLYSAR